MADSEFSLRAKLHQLQTENQRLQNQLAKSNAATTAAQSNSRDAARDQLLLRSRDAILKLEADLATSSSRIRDLEAQLASAAGREAVAYSIQAADAELHAEVARLSTRVTELETEAAAASSTASIASGDAASLRARLDSAERMRLHFETQLAAAQAELHSYQERASYDRRQWEADRQQLEGRVSDLERELRDARATGSAALAAAEKAAEQKAQLADRLQRANDEISSLQQGYSSSSEQLASVRVSESQLRGQIEELQQRAESAESSLHVLRMDSSEAVSTLQQDVTSTRSELHRVSEDLARVRAELSHSLQQRDSLQSHAASLTAEVEGLRARGLQREAAVKAAMSNWLRIVRSKFADLSASGGSEGADSSLEAHLAGVDVHRASDDDRVLSLLEALPAVGTWMRTATSSLMQQMEAKWRTAEEAVVDMQQRTSAIEASALAAAKASALEANRHQAESHRLAEQLAAVAEHLASVMEDLEQSERACRQLGDQLHLSEQHITGLEQTIAHRNEDIARKDKAVQQARKEAAEAIDARRAMEADVKRAMEASRMREVQMQKQTNAAQAELRNMAAAHAQAVSQLRDQLLVAEKQAANATKLATSNNRSALTYVADKAAALVAESSAAVAASRQHVQRILDALRPTDTSGGDGGLASLLSVGAGEEPAWLVQLRSAIAQEAASCQTLADKAERLAQKLQGRVEAGATARAQLDVDDTDQEPPAKERLLRSSMVDFVQQITAGGATAVNLSTSTATTAAARTHAAATTVFSPAQYDLFHATASTAHALNSSELRSPDMRLRSPDPAWHARQSQAETMHQQMRQQLKDLGLSASPRRAAIHQLDGAAEV